MKQKAFKDKIWLGNVLKLKDGYCGEFSFYLKARPHLSHPIQIKILPKKTSRRDLPPYILQKSLCWAKMSQNNLRSVCLFSLSFSQVGSRKLRHGWCWTPEPIKPRGSGGSSRAGQAGPHLVPGGIADLSVRLLRQPQVSKFLHSLQ